MTHPRGACAALIDRHDLTADQMAAACRARDHGRPGAGGADRPPPGRAAHEGRDRRRDRRRGARDARAGRRSTSTPTSILDTCGTGGDGAGTFNVSTAAALVAAGAGVHGRQARQPRASSRAAAPTCSRRSGVDLDLEPRTVARCLREARHRVSLRAARTTRRTRHVAAGAPRARRARRSFNLLGPLTNPAGARHQRHRRLRRRATSSRWPRRVRARAPSAPGRPRRRRPRRVSHRRRAPSSPRCSPGGVRTSLRRRARPTSASTPRDPRRAARRRRRPTTPRIARRPRGAARGRAVDVVLMTAGAALYVAGRGEHRAPASDAARAARRRRRRPGRAARRCVETVGRRLAPERA